MYACFCPLYCSTLHRSTLHCSTLHCFTLYWYDAKLMYTYNHVLYFFSMSYIILYRNLLYFTIPYCTVLHCTIPAVTRPYYTISYSTLNNFSICTHRRLRLPKVPKYLPQVTKQKQLHSTFRVLELGIGLGFLRPLPSLFRSPGNRRSLAVYVLHEVSLYFNILFYTEFS